MREGVECVDIVCYCIGVGHVGDWESTGEANYVDTYMGDCGGSRACWERVEDSHEVVEGLPAAAASLY